MTRTLVMKFGGTSVGSSTAIQQAAELISNAQADWPQIAVVISAMSGVTDLLLKGAQAAMESDAARYTSLAEEIRQKHLTTINKLLRTSEEKTDARAHIEIKVGEFLSLCHAVHVLGELTPRALDAISSLGETMSMALLAAHLREIHCPAQAIQASKLIRTDDAYQAAHPDSGATRLQTQEHLLPLFKKGITPVITGFIGATHDGVTTTLGRGGSDFSAAIIATALDAEEVWIWTDVDGVMTTDPRMVPNARTLEVVTYREISELAYFGAKVLHPKTIRPVIEQGINLWIKNTFNPNGPATRVVANRSLLKGDIGKIRAVTAIKDQSLISIEGRGMIGVQGIAARTFGAVASTDSSVSLISQASSEQSICFTTSASATNIVLNALHNEFQAELARQDIDRISALEDIVIVTVVGSGMRNTPGIAGQVFSALGNHGINVIAIAQGSSEASISLVVEADSIQDSVRAIHNMIVK